MLKTDIGKSIYRLAYLEAVREPLSFQSVDPPILFVEQSSGQQRTGSKFVTSSIQQIFTSKSVKKPRCLTIIAHG